MVYGDPNNYFNSKNIEYWVHRNDEDGVIDKYSSLVIPKMKEAE
jgi:hypothetical protein